MASGREISLVVTVGLVAALTACSDDQPDPEPVAETLADALTTGEFDDVPLAGTAADDVEAEVVEIVGGMGEAARTVAVRALVPDEESDDEAWTVTFDLSWDLDGTPDEEDGDAGETSEPDGDAEGETEQTTDDVPWSYPTSARLILVEGAEEDEWQVEWSPELFHPDLEPGARLSLQRGVPERADILGRDDTVLVTERDVYRVGIDKTRFDDDAGDDDMAEAATELADLVGVDEDRFAERVADAGEQAFVEALTLRAGEAEPLLDDIEDIDGAAAFSDTLPLAPTRDFARPILGGVGEATAEIVDESDGQIRAGDVVGLSGLQRSYDARLRGTPGFVVRIVTDDEEEDATVFEQEAVAGESLTTTLDVDLQTHAEDVLSDVDSPSAIVAIEPSSGEVLAAASGPGSEGYSTATAGQYPPGSTFKVVTSLALLRAGLDPGSTLDCPSTTTVDGREFGNYSAYPDSALGEISLATAVAESCNTAFINERGEVSQADLLEAARSLGLGGGDELGMPAFFGSVPAEAEGTAHAAAMIGQGEVLASPLAMATVVASVAAGETVSPRLVTDGGGAGDGSDDAETDEAAGEDAEDGDGGSDDGSADSGDSSAATPLTGDEVEQLEEMMRLAVEDGSASLLQDVPGDPVAAKTGTAEYQADDGTGLHAWMVAFQGDLAVAVFVEDGESGSRTAGPLLEEFLSDRP